MAPFLRRRNGCDEDYDFETSSNYSFSSEKDIRDQIRSYRTKYGKYLPRNGVKERNTSRGYHLRSHVAEEGDGGVDANAADFENMSQDEIFATFINSSKMGKTNEIDVSGESGFCSIDDDASVSSSVLNSSYSTVFGNCSQFSSSSEIFEEKTVPRKVDLLNQVIFKPPVAPYPFISTPCKSKANSSIFKSPDLFKHRELLIKRDKNKLKRILTDTNIWGSNNTNSSRDSQDGIRKSCEQISKVLNPCNVANKRKSPVVKKCIAVGLRDKGVKITHEESLISKILDKANKFLETAESLSQLELENERVERKIDETSSLEGLLNDFKSELHKINETVSSVRKKKAKHDENSPPENHKKVKKTKKVEACNLPISDVDDDFTQDDLLLNLQKANINSSQNLLISANSHKPSLNLNSSPFSIRDVNMQIKKHKSSSLQSMKSIQGVKMQVRSDKQSLNLNISPLNVNINRSQNKEHKGSSQNVYNVSDLIQSSSQKYLQEISSTISSQEFNEGNIVLADIFENTDYFINHTKIDLKSLAPDKPAAAVEVIINDLHNLRVSNQSDLLQQALLKMDQNPDLKSGAVDQAPAPTKASVLLKIRDVFMGLKKDLKGSKKVVIALAKYNQWNNVVFEDDVLTYRKNALVLKILKDRKSKAGCCKFKVVVYLLMKIYTLLMTGATCTKREIYYQIMMYVNKQTQVNDAYDDVCCLLETPPWVLGIMPSGRGLVFGNLNLVINKTSVNCNLKGGILIPQDVKDITRIETDAKFILIVEKDSIFQKMLDENAPNKLCKPFILLTGKGYPDTNTRLFAKKLSVLLKLPMFILVDADPYGIEIMLSYRFGTLGKPRSIISTTFGTPPSRRPLLPEISCKNLYKNGYICKFCTYLLENDLRSKLVGVNITNQ